MVSQINFDKQTCFSLGTFPSLHKEGWLRHQSKVAKPPKSRRRGGRSRDTFHKRIPSIVCERPPRPRLFSERIHFANGASTPPLQGGECTYAKSVSNMKWDTTLVYGRTWPVAEATQIHVVLNWLEELKQRGL